LAEIKTRNEVGGGRFEATAFLPPNLKSAEGGRSSNLKPQAPDLVKALSLYRVKSRGIKMDEREYPDRPWLGVGGIVFKDDQILLVKRGKEPGLGRWSIPGGVVDLGETAAQALEREYRRKRV